MSGQRGNGGDRAAEHDNVRKKRPLFEKKNIFNLSFGISSVVFCVILLTNRPTNQLASSHKLKHDILLRGR